MKKIFILAFISAMLFISLGASAQTYTLKIKGKGGIVLNPDGSQAICPNKSKETCYTVEASLWDIILIKLDEWFKEANGSSSGGSESVPGFINDHMPMMVTLRINCSEGIVVRQGQLLWLDPYALEYNAKSGVSFDSEGVRVNLLN